MAPETLLITGATGLIGSQVLARAVLQGQRVRALVRGSVPDFMNHPLVTVIQGDLSQDDVLAKAVDGVTAIVHCAAKVGDWGDAATYKRVNIGGTQSLLTAALTVQGLQRFVAISSLGVYQARHHFGTTEATPPCVSGLDPYTRTKAAAEELVHQAYRRGLPTVILRPGFVYGPRDRHVLPQLAAALRNGRFAYFGSGEQLLDNTGVHNVVEAVFLALRLPSAIGEVFNITDAELVSRRIFVGAVAAGLGLDVAPRALPLWLAWALTASFERWARWLGSNKAPLLSRARYKFLALHLEFSIAKAQRILGYRPVISFADGMAEATAWLRAQTVQS